MNLSKKTALVLVSIFSLSLLPSCLTGNLGNLAQTAQTFQNPKVNIKSVSLGDFNLQEINFKVTITVENPNDIGAKTSNIEYNLELAKTKLISGTLDKGLDLQAKKTVEVEVPMKVETSKLLAVAPTIASNLSNLDYAVYGTLSVDTPVGKVPVPWRKEDKINLLSLASLVGGALLGGIK
ncbi:MAG: LEA type 2 family protein [Candidatus Sericytochromatia bacterium]